MIKIAVASGKGGTGKTTVAVNLAISLLADQDVWFLDCDVEAPNAHIFLKPEFNTQSQAVILIPQIDASSCTLCGKCVEVCQFHALAKVGKHLMVFKQLCHGCGSCVWNCPEKAITEVPHPIGVLETGLTADGIHFSRGVLTVSEPMPTPIIRQLKLLAQPPAGATVILDAPPGASCSVVETLRNTDFVLLVTEPTPFGLHDLDQMVSIVREMQLPAGVIINRDGIGDDRVEKYLADHNLPILMRIPYNQKLAAGIAAGNTIIEILPEYRQAFRQMYSRILVQANKGVPC